MARGGKRNGAGRKPGIQNKATMQLKELAQEHAPEMLGEIVRLATSAQSESVRLAACNAILDRGFGKAVQQEALTDEKSIEERITDIQETRAKIRHRMERLIEAETEIKRGD